MRARPRAVEELSHREGPFPEDNSCNSLLTLERYGIRDAQRAKQKLLGRSIQSAAAKNRGWVGRERRAVFSAVDVLACS